LFVFLLCNVNETVIQRRIIKPNGKHLTEDDRAFIAEALTINMPFREIAKNLVKYPTTISKEIQTGFSNKQAAIRIICLTFHLPVG
jgi:hypothetical protein